MISIETYITCLLSIVLVMSVLSLGMYAMDKRRATRGKWRISESTLHLMAVLGGWPGAVAGQRLFRHKTRKLSFRIVLAVTIVVNVAAWWLLWHFAVRA